MRKSVGRAVGFCCKRVLRATDAPLDAVEKSFRVQRTRRWMLLKKVSACNGILLKNTGNHIGLPLRDPLL